MAANIMDEILKNFPDLEEGWKEIEEELKAEPSEREMLSLKYREMVQMESSKESLGESEFTKAKRAESDSKVMKANVPEKIWIDPTNDLPKLSGNIDKGSVEYIRKDVFVEIVSGWLKDCATITYMNGEKHIDKEMYKATVEDFKKYIRGKKV